MELRDYQRDAVTACLDAWQTHQSVLAVLPTGMGKTEIFVHLASQWQEGRVLVIAPMIELIGQAARKIAQRTGITPAIEQGDLRSDETGLYPSPFIVASKQTLTGKTKRYERFADIGLVIIDEAHLAATAKYREMVEWFVQRHGAKILGVTATPKRHDRVGLHNLFDTCAYQLSIHDAVQAGWLVPARAQCLQVESLDLSAVETAGSKGDFKQEALAKVMEDEKVVHEIATITRDEYRGEKTVVFCATVAEARGVAEVLVDRYGVNARWVCGDAKLCPKQQRHATLKDFTAGDVDVVCNVGVLTTGWDFPGLQHIVMARPTKSLPLYTQIFGRGTRPLPGVVDFAGSTPESRREAIAASAKPHFRITDLRDNSMRHKLVTAIDVLGGTALCDATRRLAAAAMAAGRGEQDVQAVLDEAAREQAAAKRRADEERQARYRARLAAIQATATVARHDVDPFGAGEAATTRPANRHTPRMPFGKHKGEPISQVPTNYLRWIIDLGRKGWVTEACRKELAERTGAAPQPSPRPADEIQLDFFSQLRKSHASA